MDDLVPPATAGAARRMRALIAAREDNRDLVLMGAYRAGADPLLDEALALSGVIDSFLMQARGSAEPLAASQQALIDLMGAGHA
jgi:flagellum-specific ATP synthase